MEGLGKKTYAVTAFIVGVGTEELLVEAKDEREAKRLAHDEYVRFRRQGYLKGPFRIVGAVERKDGL